MIVNYTSSGWQIISQRSHGLLAAQICAHWDKNNQPECWVETLIATAEHDDVYNELDNEELINAQGGPIDFKETGFKKILSQKLIDMAETKSAYTALLLSRHIQFVHGSDPKATTFIKKLKKQEAGWIKTAACSKAEITRGYELLEFCDAFSLLIAQGLIQPEHRKIEISNGPDGTAYQMYASDSGLVVSPWPFEIPFFTVSYESRSLAQLRFASSSAFRDAFKQAEVIRHELRIIREN
ncbi:MAG TPA: DUF3891 family protein [Pedobacter sp.]|nr:DUF3891 family protein [Pedobacter sp.]